MNCSYISVYAAMNHSLYQYACGILLVHQIIFDVFFCIVLKSYIKLALNALSQNSYINLHSNSAKLVLIWINSW